MASGLPADYGVVLDDAVRDLRGVDALDYPIVGTDAATLDHRGPGVIAATPLPSPKEPTPAARERHNLTHALRGLVSGRCRMSGT